MNQAVGNFMASRVTVIAEIGSNYNGSLELAKQYVIASKTAGANAVKFQTLRRDLLVAPHIIRSEQLVDNPSYDKFASLGLPDEWHYEIKSAADKEGIEFFSTPFYLGAVDLLESVGVSTYKIASGDITFFPLLERVGWTGQRVLLSTGASSLGDVERALEVLTAAGTHDIVLLHCVCNYPPQWDEINLRAMVTLREAFGFPVGISDHSPGSVIPIAAVALGASVIEKHVTFDRDLSGPDHSFAMTLDEFGGMVKQVRLLERSLGTGQKAPTKTEMEKQSRLRRSAYGLDERWLRPEGE